MWVYHHRSELEARAWGAKGAEAEELQPSSNDELFAAFKVGHHVKYSTYMRERGAVLDCISVMCDYQRSTIPYNEPR